MFAAMPALAVALLLVLVGCTNSAEAPQSSQQPEQSSGSVDEGKEIRMAEALGRDLYQAFVSSEAKITGQSALLIAQAKEAIKDFCDVPYRAVPVYPSLLIMPHHNYVYFIGTPDSADDLMIGRHYRVVVNNWRNTVGAVTSSTKTCLIIPRQDEAVAAVTSHLLSPTPTEFHVFASLKAGKPIYVSTSDGRIWKVDGDSITIVK